MYVCVPLMPLQNDFFLGGGYLFVYLFPVWLVQYVCLCVCTCVCVCKRERESSWMLMSCQLYMGSTQDNVWCVCLRVRVRENVYVPVLLFVKVKVQGF